MTVPDPLLETLRAAFAADLADAVIALEGSLLALEGEASPEERTGILREVFRVSHGLKGSARAAGLAPVERTCHAMESLLGLARDQELALGREDMAALLAAVDALKEVQQALAQGPDRPLDEPMLAAAGERIEARVEVAGRHHAASRHRTDRTGGGAPHPRPRSRSVWLRLAPERLDALSATGGALLGAAHQAEARAARIDELVREARRARSSLRAARPVLARLAAATSPRERLQAHAAASAVSADEGLQRFERALALVGTQAEADARMLERRTRRLAGQVRALRLTPWTDATAGLDRVARDLAASLQKEVEVAVSGNGLELDRSIVDALRDPLAQLVRNAVDHGIEPAAARAAAGKPPRGRIELSAEVQGERVLVRVADDGRGLDSGLLAEEARRRGLTPPADPRRLLELVFLPGFSTAASVTEVSGRGVGLDVVASAVRAMRGTVAISSEPGRGTTFRLVLPTTLYGVRAVLARDEGQVFALPALEIERVVRVAPGSLAVSAGRPVLLADEPVPLAPLAHALGLASGDWAPEHRRVAVVVEAGGQRAAFAVEEVLAERELSLEPLGPRLQGLPLATAVAVLPGGDLAVVLSLRDLVERVAGGPSFAPAVPQAEERSRRPRVLVADDAATTRTLARSILEASGYEVATAADGQQAWALVQQGGVDVVVSDVEMPGMNGFDLTRAIRQSQRFGAIPVVLLTALGSEADRRHGLEAGADAYLVKSAFEQRELLETLAQLLHQETS